MKVADLILVPFLCNESKPMLLKVLENFVIQKIHHVMSLNCGVLGDIMKNQYTVDEAFTYLVVVVIMCHNGNSPGKFNKWHSCLSFVTINTGLCEVVMNS